MNSGQSQKLAVGSMVLQYTKAAMKNATHPVILSTKRNSFINLKVLFSSTMCKDSARQTQHEGKLVFLSLVGRSLPSLSGCKDSVNRRQRQIKGSETDFYFNCQGALEPLPSREETAATDDHATLASLLTVALFLPSNCAYQHPAVTKRCPFVRVFNPKAHLQ